MRGIVQVAMGDQFVAEATVSAVSARRHLDVPITLFTDQPEAARAMRAFDDVVAIERSGRRPHRDKLVAMRQTPFERALFLDTDTYVGATLDDCWELLDHFDLAAAGDRGLFDDFPPGTGVPDSYKEINSGVVFFRRSAEMDAMLDLALEHYDRMDTGEGARVFDQTVLRLAMYRAPLRVATLTEEDNCRFASYGKLNGPVRVLHGRLPRARHTADNLERVLARLNATTAPRTFIAGHAWALQPQRLQLTGGHRAARMPSYRILEARSLASHARYHIRRRLRAGPERDARKS